MTLKQIREELSDRKPGKWSHSKTYEDVEVAHDEHLAPSVFWAIEENDRAYMIARKRTHSTMEAWENYLHEKKMDQISAKSGKGKGGNK